MTIKCIKYEDVHRITSGQVIIDLTTAVKEVLENALDAEATRVEIIFKNYGLDTITINDNGSGIKQDDFESICLKHYTSKLSDFSDVEKVQTFGFRGEAMSSLCAISNVNIITATKKDAPKAWSLKYNFMGELELKELTSRTKGTTVRISDLFKNLPVRRIDLKKNIKREYHKALHFIQCYAIIATGVRLIVRNIDSRGRKSILLTTTGSKQLKMNLISVFGSAVMQNLEPIDISIQLPVHISDESETIHIAGYISNSSFGQGRSSTDRMYWYVNGRPVTLPRFSKAVTEAYRKFNRLQYPMIVLNMEVDQKYVDVNVTPDKRTVLVDNESKILELLREKFAEIFSVNDMKIPINGEASDRINKRAEDTKQLTLERFSAKNDSSEENNVNEPKEIPNESEKMKEEIQEKVKEEIPNDEDPVQEDVKISKAEIRPHAAPEHSKHPAKVVTSSHTIQNAVPVVPSKASLLHKFPSETTNFTTYGLEQHVKFKISTNRYKRRRIDDDNDNDNDGKTQKLDNIADTENAEQLLTLTVSKDDFLQMKVVGQFNLGFIIVTRRNVKSGGLDLFIVDQHASDEKYNFERLQRETTFQNQPLVVPQELELNAIDEMIVINNKEIFKKNGFKLRINTTAGPGKKVSIMALPYSKNTQFGLADFYELVNMVRESEGNKAIRPSKVRAMFAMRACRSSIMIGRPLNGKTMTTVIRHLSGLDKPWNCPHGRPTMRHLVELQNWATFDEDCH